MAKKTNYKKYLEDTTTRPLTKWQSEYRNCFDWTFQPVTERFIEAFFQDLVKSAADEEGVMSLQEFYLSKGVPSKTFNAWCNRFEQAADAIETAKELIALKREKLALKNKINAGVFLAMQPRYCPEYKALLEWKASLTAKNPIDDNRINVIINDVQSSSLVPLRGEKKLNEHELTKAVGKMIAESKEDLQES
jgi:hypothetical protein